MEGLAFFDCEQLGCEKALELSDLGGLHKICIASMRVKKTSSLRYKMPLVWSFAGMFLASSVMCHERIQ